MRKQALYQATLIYTVSDAQDGSASCAFHADIEAAALACEIEEESGVAFSDNDPCTRTLLFDASGLLLNPDALDDESDDTGLAGHFSAAGRTPKKSSLSALPANGADVTLHYIFRNEGDGSASVQFYADAATAERAAEIEEDSHAPLGDLGPHSVTLRFGSTGLLLTPTQSREELKDRLAELRGEDTPPPAPAPAARRPKR